MWVRDGLLFDLASSSLEQSTGDDYRRLECRECGRYPITGSVLQMLDSRLS